MAGRDAQVAPAQRAWAIRRDHLLYLAIIAIYCLPYLFGRDLFYRDETRYGAVVKEMIGNDAWFTLTIGNDFYPEKPPLFFSLVRLLAEIAGTTAPWVFFLAVAVTAFFFVAASDAFLRAAGFDRRTVRWTNLLILAVPWIVIHMQIVRMDLLFSGLILFSVASYVSGIERSSANFLPLLGGLLAGLAALTKGPFGVLIPVLAIVAYLVITRRLRLLVRIDVASSLVPMLLPVLAWLFSIYATFGDRIFDAIFGEQILERALSGRDAHRPWWLYPLWIGWTLMPWLLLAPALFDRRIRGAAFSGPAIAESERRLPGFRLILPYLAVCIVLLGLTAQKNIHYLLPLVPALMVLVAIAYRRLDAAVPRLIDWFYAAMAVIILIAPPLAVLAVNLLSEKSRAGLSAYIRPETLQFAAIALTLTAIPLALATRMRGERRLLAGIASVAVMVIALKAIILPDLDRAYSPRHAAATFEPLVPNGAPIVVYGFYWGALSYHFDRPLIYVESPGDLRTELAAQTHPNFAIATMGDWAGNPDLWEGFVKIGESRLEKTRFVLLKRRDQS
jgi:4-amino-4-deoxy-L-arabinose transferase-like glycosyltransferase